MVSLPNRKKQTSHPGGPMPRCIHGVHQALSQSLAAERAICSICSQMELISATRHLSALGSLQQENILSSYYRLTAAGCLERMEQGDWHESVLAVMVESMYRARDLDRQKRGHMQAMKRNAGKEVHPAIENLMSWLDESEQHLQQAMIHAQNTIGSRRWHQLAPQKQPL